MAMMRTRGRGVFFGLELADGGGGLVAVEFGHVAVHEDGVVAAGRKFFHGLAAVLDPVGAGAKAVEHQLPELAVERMVLGGENPEAGNGRAACRRFCAGPFRCRRPGGRDAGFRFLPATTATSASNRTVRGRA